MKSIGNLAEDTIARIVSNPILTEFVHVRPQFKHGMSWRELCDILVEDEPRAVLIQIKVQGVVQARQIDAADKWASKKLEEASRQALGALRKCVATEVEISNPNRPERVFSAGQLLPAHALILIDQTGNTLRICSELPRRSTTGTPIHYLSVDDFIFLCEELMTLPDLLMYLDERATIPAWATPSLGLEKDAYAYNLMHKGKFGYHLGKADIRGEWNRLNTEHHTQYQEKLSEDRKAGLIASILETMHESRAPLLDELPDFYSPDHTFDVNERVRATRELNRLNRLYRRQIADKLREKATLADSSTLGFNSFAIRPENSRVYYLFLASRHPKKVRIEQLTVAAYCILNVTDAELVIGVATQSKETGREFRSYDIVVLDESQRDFDPETISNCKKFYPYMQYERLYDFPSDKTSRIISP